MRRATKVVLGVVLVLVGLAAWRIRLLPTTVETRRKGDCLVAETRTRSYRWLTPNEWAFGSKAEEGSTGGATWHWSSVSLGLIEVADTCESVYTLPFE